MTIERVNNSLGYVKSNCVWATQTTQGRNKRNNKLVEFEGKIQCVSAWAEELGIGYQCLWSRLYQHKIPVDVAFSLRKYKWHTKANPKVQS